MNLKVTNGVVAFAWLLSSTQLSCLAQPSALKGWDVTTPAINVANAIARPGKSLLPEHVWLRRDTENTYILIQAKGLSRALRAEQSPAIFLSLFFDSDGNAQTGSHGTDIDGQEFRGFDVKADLSTMQVRDRDGRVSSVLNCQVSKWDGTQFSGNIAWGTQFNSKMSAVATGEYASFSIPRSVLDVSPKGTLARVAFDIPEAQYNPGRSLIERIRVTEK